MDRKGKGINLNWLVGFIEGEGVAERIPLVETKYELEEVEPKVLLEL